MSVEFCLTFVWLLLNFVSFFLTILRWSCFSSFTYYSLIIFILTCSHWWVFPGTSAPSVLAPTMSHSHSPTPPGDTLLLPRSCCAWDFVCTLQEWSFCFPHSYGAPAIKHPGLESWVLWGTPPLDGRPPDWGAWHVLQNSRPCGKTYEK